MTSRVSLVAPAMSASLRAARFDDDGPLEPGGAARARAMAGALPVAARMCVSPTVRCRETARALGLEAVAEGELARLDVGRWRGRTLEEVAAAEPEALARWLSDPRAAPHGGEPVSALCARVAARLDGWGTEGGRTLAVVEPEIVRAVAVAVLGTGPDPFWRLDVPPLTLVEVVGGPGRWRLRLGGEPAR
ncbi:MULTISPECIES: histidine phosphatase family protein [Streptomyces]|uniref:Phosphoglycerate mutase n=1 Tax=Streptomyces cacaoi TaxID=1898 RepID=A0A4Y3R535_STRCI|nr:MULTISPECIES: histidine phosphatase family protein [Streptomyces]NNG83700.1 histidine phosphatase family protein [Streptomyces cacaoi]QHF96059.1 histidine phosphatase family protein [Streptomyces sp. NHF165]GEB52755.1 phosphoglycerate mutase [Streptomyces cacaoi]